MLFEFVVYICIVCYLYFIGIVRLNSRRVITDILFSTTCGMLEGQRNAENKLIYRPSTKYSRTRLLRTFLQNGISSFVLIE